MQEELATIQKLYDVAAEFMVQYSFQIVGAIIIFIIGIKLAGWLGRLTVNLCEKHSVDITLSKFLGNVIKVLVLAFVIIIVIGKFGISITPMVAAISALAFGASFAVQGPLSNYGAGLSIIISRPFVVGNTITIHEVNGIVKEIGLAATILTTEDEEEITIPNKHIVGEIIRNSFANKVVEGSVGISYEDDPKKAISAIKSVLEKVEAVCQDPAPQIGIDEFADSAINIGLRYWVPTQNYFQVRFKVNAAIHQALAENKISIPFPQRDVHLINKQN
ncbi:MAG: mechanosensitive ion channel family protein [Proteobacteria bacterium]|nr:mechanosensitive ion channel family protein [Pseudomonadota bacterium]